MRLCVSPRAADDLDAIVDYLTENSPAAAARVLQRIEAQARQLLEQPDAGRARPELGAGLRHRPVGAYLILYRVVGDDVEIIRVVHGRRDLGDLSLADERE